MNILEILHTNILEILQWSGCVFGLSGALLQALNLKISVYGFVLFLLSNFAWIAAGYVSQVGSLSVMNIGFTVTSVIGIYRGRKSL